MADNVIGIEIVTRLDAFEKELAKIPDMTADAAKAMVAELHRSIKNGTRASITETEKARSSLQKMVDSSASSVDQLTKAFERQKAEILKLGAASKDQELTAAALAAAQDDFNRKLKAMPAEAAADKIGNVGDGFARLGGALDMVDPKLGEIARGLGDMGDVGEVAGKAVAGMGLKMTTVLPPVAIAVAAATAAWFYFNKELERAEEKATKAGEAAKQAGEDAKRLNDLQGSIRDKALIATGQATEKEIELRDAVQSVTGEYGPRIEKAKQAAQAADAEASASKAAYEEMLRGDKASGPALQRAYDRQEAAAFAANDHRNKLSGLTQEQGKYLQLAAQGVLIEKKDESAKKGSAKATKEKTDALAALNAQMALEQAQAMQTQATYQGSLNTLASIAEAQEAAGQSAEERLTNEYNALKALIDLEERRAMGSAGESITGQETAASAASRARTAADAEYARSLEELRSKEAEAAKESALKLAEEDQARREAMLGGYRDAAFMAADIAQDAASRMADAFGEAYQSSMASAQAMMEWERVASEHLTESQKKKLHKRIEAQKRAARAAFEANKIVALASAAVNTAVGVTQALSSAPPPFSFINAGLVGLAGGIEIGVIASQQPAFHKGGPLDLAPDEMSITARRSEYMLNPTGRGIVGDDNLSKANAGMSGAGSSGGDVVVVNMYKHTKQVERWKKDGLLAGDAIAKAIASGKLVGHRSQR